MGYYIYLQEHDFTVKAEHTGTVIERWRAHEKAVNSGYSSIFDGETEGEENIAQLFGNIGFEVAVTDEAVTIDGWEGKAWRQDEYIRAIADLAEPGWFLAWQGEDGECWRESAEGTAGGVVVYVNYPPLVDEGKAALALYDSGKGGGAPAMKRALAALVEALS